MDTHGNMSAENCGCDPGCKPEPHVCEGHRTGAFSAAIDKMFMAAALEDARQERKELIESGRKNDLNLLLSEGAKAWDCLKGIHDSGERVTYASGSMRDPSEGKIKWSRIFFGPMARRWAQHLTTAEAKYPDVAPGVPNFTLINTQEELLRYKESALRHFMSWYFDEADEDHAAAVMFNVNGVEIVKAKQRGEKIDGIKEGL